MIDMRTVPDERQTLRAGNYDARIHLTCEHSKKGYQMVVAEFQLDNTPNFIGAILKSYFVVDPKFAYSNNHIVDLKNLCKNAGFAFTKPYTNWSDLLKEVNAINPRVGIQTADVFKKRKNDGSGHYEEVSEEVYNATDKRETFLETKVLNTKFAPAVNPPVEDLSVPNLNSEPTDGDEIPF